MFDARRPSAAMPVSAPRRPAARTPDACVALLSPPELATVFDADAPELAVRAGSGGWGRMAGALAGGATVRASAGLGRRRRGAP